MKHSEWLDVMNYLSYAKLILHQNKPVDGSKERKFFLAADAAIASAQQTVHLYPTDEGDTEDEPS